MGVSIGFCQQDHPFTIKMESHGILWNLMESCGISQNLVESRGILWNLMESCPVTIEVVFLSKSVSYNNEMSESNNEVEFLQINE